MWLSRWRTETVTCIACGETIPRSEAREYDKYGNRWEREGKTFEYFCKPCDGDLCRYGRDGLEAQLTDLEAGEHSQEAFLRRYLCSLEERRRVEER
ncbi:DUF7562 family protein [Natronosalvus rutilus]|uniref:Small CPxCG-related zinc finger protein n=1 Tax=Natronosalvus rutilus TaxID=2953753 RepID=A0A9E7SWE8_9EURY|nr:hypothetical protein [Natronosalvus rutilus]UTF54972.1 hypothetical protein NGM29_06880 [Natronosalvus rutilus]